MSVLPYDVGDCIFTRPLAIVEEQLNGFSLCSPFFFLLVADFISVFPSPGICVLSFFGPPDRRPVDGSFCDGHADTRCETGNREGVSLFNSRNVAVVVGESPPLDIVEEAGDESGDWFIKTLLLVLLLALKCPLPLNACCCGPCCLCCCC